MEGDICPICNKKVLIHMYALTCNLCSCPIHRNCTLFNNDEYNDFVKTGSQDWTCSICAESIFPFNHIVVDDVFQSALFELSSDCCLLDPDYVQPKMFDPFNLNDEKDYIPCTDIDPDSCYYNELSFSIQKNSNYYHEDSFNHSLLKVFQNSDLFILYIWI